MKKLFSIAMIAVAAISFVGCSQSTEDKTKAAGESAAKDVKDAATKATDAAKDTIKK